MPSLPNKRRNKKPKAKAHHYLRARRGKTLLLAAVNGASLQRRKARTVKTQARRLLAWSRYLRFIRACGVRGDPYLQRRRSLQGLERIDFLCAFAYCLRNDFFNANNGHQPKLEGIQQTLGVVCQKFEDEGYLDPSRTATGRLRSELRDLYKSFKDEDPAVFKRAALSSDMRKHLREGRGDELADAIGELVDGGIFFAMRSCEYCYTSDPDPKTEVITLGDIVFLKHGRRIEKNLEEADTVIITFRSQKNGVKDEKQARISKKDAKWSAVKCWAKIVNRIKSYRGTDADTPISTVKVNGTFYQIKAEDVNKEIKRAAIATGAKLELKRYSSHSVRVTFATLLFLKGESMDIVKFLGRWRSDAFILYIRNTIRMMTIETEMEADYEQVE